ncbi:MAG: HAD family hydrolase [Oscillospiraceae bacterium]|jgi:phosphoglycolate phosphatase|nr:HAD family hydrolase [Oscillospiraceae bacterium]
MITTVIFDMDGTVLNTLDDLAASVNYVLTRYGMPVHCTEDYRRYFGNGIRYALQCAVPKGTEEAAIDQMIPVFREHYNAHCLDKTRPYDGIQELMKALRDRGYKLAIVSNKIDSAVKELNAKFFSDYVDVAIGEREGIRRKPAPDTVVQALEELKSAKHEAVYIGDSEVDLQTAANAGLPCISVLWGFREKDFLTEQGAAVFVNTPQEIYDLLGRGTL